MIKILTISAFSKRVAFSFIGDTEGLANSPQTCRCAAQSNVWTKSSRTRTPAAILAELPPRGIRKNRSNDMYGSICGALKQAGGGGGHRLKLLPL